MIKNDIAVIGIGLCGENNALLFQKRNYTTLLINGSEQDNKTLISARNVLKIEGYDGFAGDRSSGIKALKANKNIIKEIKSIEEKVIILIASGGGTTGSSIIPILCDIIKESNPNKIVCAILVMPRKDEAIQKRINAYEAAKELIEIEELNATIFVDNNSNDDVQKINNTLVSMLDAFFTDNSYSSNANFDDSEKLKCLSDHGMFVITMKNNADSQEIIESLTSKNIFCPMNTNDGIVSNIGIINAKGSSINQNELIKALGTPENVFVQRAGTVNIVCASGLSFPTEYISKLGKSAMTEQKERLDKRKSLSILDDLEIEESTTAARKPSKARQDRLNLLRELD